MNSWNKVKPVLYLFIGAVILLFASVSLYGYPYNHFWLALICGLAAAILGIIAVLYFVVTVIKVIFKI